MDFEELGIPGVNTKEDLLNLYGEITSFVGVDPADKSSLSRLRIIRPSGKNGEQYVDTAAFVSHAKSETGEYGQSNTYEDKTFDKMLKGQSRADLLFKETRFFDPNSDKDLQQIAEICVAYNQNQLYWLGDGTFANKSLVTNSKYGMVFFDQQQMKDQNLQTYSTQNELDKIEYAYLNQKRAEALEALNEKKKGKKKETIIKDSVNKKGIEIPAELKADVEEKTTINPEENYKDLHLNRQRKLNMHINGKDKIANISQHVMKTTSADYGKLKTMTKEEIANREVHHGKGKEQRLNGEHVLEFIVAGSGYSQMAKTYKGFSGRNEYAQIEKDPADEQVLSEIQTTIGRKYNVTYGNKKGQEQEFRQALDKEFGKPLYVNKKGQFSKTPQEDTRVLNGVREKVDGTRTRYNLSGPMEKFIFMKDGSRNKGDYSIENLRSYMIELADKWLENINKTYDPKDPNAKPIHIYMKGHSRGACAADEASAAINALLETKYKSLKDKVHIETQLLDPVPGADANKAHDELDHTKSSITKQGISMRGLGCDKNNDTTVFYGVHINHNYGFTPKIVKGTSRVILSGKSHDMGIFDIDNGHKKGHIFAENGQEYRGSGMSDLKNGLFIEDENNVLMEIKNSQEAHDLIDSMVKGKSKQGSRHEIMHQLVDNWFTLHQEEITPKDIRFGANKEIQQDQKAMQDYLKAMAHPDPDMRPADPKNAKYAILANMFAHEQLFDDLTAAQRKKDRNSILEKKTQLADIAVNKLMTAPAFKKYADSLTRSELMQMATGDKLKIKEHIKMFQAQLKLTKDAKKAYEDHRYQKKYFDEVKGKEFFFEKHTDGNNSFKEIGKDGRLGLSVDQGTLSNLAICAMLENGHKLEDILNPDKLQSERQQVGDEVMKAYKTLNNVQLAQYCAEKFAIGSQMAVAELSAKLDEIPQLTNNVLNSPENRVFQQAAGFLKDVGKEMSGNREVHAHVEAIFGKGSVNRVLDNQKKFSSAKQEKEMKKETESVSKKKEISNAVRK